MKTDIIASVVEALGAYLYAPIFRLGENEFALLYACQDIDLITLEVVSQTFSFGSSSQEAFNIGLMSQEGTLPYVEGMEFTGKVWYLLDEESIERRFGFCSLPSHAEMRATMVLLSGPLFEASEGAPDPLSGQAPKAAALSTPLILRGFE